MFLPNIKNKKTVLLCVGSELRGDDAFGPLLYAAMQGAQTDNFLVLDGGEVPEALSGQIKRFAPELLIVADAAAFGGVAGEVRLLNSSDITNASFSTHGMPLGMLIKFLESEIIDLQTIFIAVQAGSTALGSAPCPAVLSAVNYIKEELFR